MGRFTRGRSIGTVVVIWLGVIVATASWAAPVPAGSVSSDYRLWYVIGNAGGSGSSATYSLSWTAGQNAIGRGGASSFEMNRGYWQNFSTSCCVGKRGNISMSGIVDISDLSILVSYLTGGNTTLLCYEEGNISGTGIVDLADLSALISYLSGGGYVLPNCS